MIFRNGKSEFFTGKIVKCMAMKGKGVVMSGFIFTCMAGWLVPETGKFRMMIMLYDGMGYYDDPGQQQKNDGNIPMTFSQTPDYS